MATGLKGEKHLCGVCKNWHMPHRPDNCTQIPICPECWKSANINTRIFALSCAGVASKVAGLDRSVLELLDGVTSVVTASQRGTGPDNSGN